MDAWASRIVYGTPDRVTESVNHVQAATGADEIILVPEAHSLDALARSTELIADVYGTLDTAAGKAA
ncbi:hypothetical protein [Streptomyces griseomycini]|uniref:Alkanesulfonate monooxygenase SsuD/methylene tetrahydromethanopterin reductase-like flavin-dependent oxidoreductase (Luciferase family) n=1 Tax=Streptomyces griseomycini TaxID=66895 RepID=A0A7W7M014_9ACTN|nr:hypothetical protein [Streptomyces griseomycini]MBB4899457.1 alkanesulfonate monooxygenase SsuD/methylene tetrahydromethanopterin reductase-like flavin-dependent oxidoreductase (luciferase family) [Streptomyces griseomycini]GGR55495.1 hypothetical protein GCM10015536_70970 [Streptomyces griseomycini]